MKNTKISKKLILVVSHSSWWKRKKYRKETFSILKKYKDNGFDIIGVSLDRTREQWEQAVIDDNLPWTQVSNLNFWNDPVARRYSIRAIPQSYLIDQSGTVIGKNLRGNDLEERIKFALSLND